MGAICKYCDQDMRLSDGCVKMPITLKDGRKLDPIPYGNESEDYSGKRNPPECHDCAARSGISPRWLRLGTVSKLWWPTIKL